jgi:N-acetylneuraminic acid mutarotase
MNYFGYSIRCITSVLIVGIASSFLGCKKKDDTTTTLAGAWVQRSTFEGVVRSNAASFTINGIGYVGTGFDGSNRLKDFWQYDPAQNFWQQKADFPGNARNEAVGFGAGGKGYIGTGFDGTTIYKDFYQYDPGTDKWTQIADFGGGTRYGTVGFSLYDVGYVGTGFDGTYKKDFWSYNSSNNTWTQVVSIPGDKRIDAIAFVINQKAYVGTGINNGAYLNDFYEYDPTILNWNQKADLAADVNGDGTIDHDVRRSGAVAFTTANNTGIVSTGNYNGLLKSTFQYNPADNTWAQMVDFAGTARENAVGLTVGTRGFLIGGKNGNSRYDDFWEFTP